MKTLKKSAAFLLCFVLIICALPMFTFAEQELISPVLPKISYSAHISNVGWKAAVSSGETAGLPEQNHRLEALKIDFPDSNLDVSCGVHVATIGWMQETGKGSIAGTVGRSLSVEGIYISLSGEGSENYDILYRTSVEGYGWLNWAKNGEYSGSQGFSIPIHQIEIKICEKGTEIPACENPAFLKTNLSYSAHVSNVGWMAQNKQGETAGIIDDTHKIEAFKFNFSTKEDLKLNCGIHVSSIGWMNNLTSGQTVGTTGRSLSAEGFYLSLMGSDSDKYDIWYRSYTDYFGWLGWAKNGEYSGTQGLSMPIHGAEIKLCLKDTFKPEDIKPAFQTKVFAYKTHVSDIGWMQDKLSGEISGTADESHNIEAIQVDVVRGFGDLSVISYVNCKNVGWMENVNPCAIAGTTGRSLCMSAVSFALGGSKASEYNVYYRTYLKGVGWLDWSENGEKNGSEDCGTAISGLQLVIASADGTDIYTGKPVKEEYGINPQKISNNIADCKVKLLGNEEFTDIFDVTPKSYNDSMVPIAAIKTQINPPEGENIGVSYAAHFANVGWVDSVADGAELFENGNSVEAVCFELTGSDATKYDIWYTAYIKNYGWLSWAKNGDFLGSTGISYPIYALKVAVLPKDTFKVPYYGDTLKTTSKAKRVYLFAIDAGHGGKDSGAIGLGGRYECNDTIKVANEVERILKAQGQNTYMTDRNHDALQRGIDINNINADIFISIHRDSTTAKNGPSGISVYTHEPSHIQRTQEPQKTYAPNESPNKHSLDTLLINNLKNNLSGASKIGIKGIYYGSSSAPIWQDYYINRITNMAGCIVELGFVNNTNDNTQFDAHYKDFAKAIAKSMMEAVGISFDESKYTR